MRRLPKLMSKSKLMRGYRCHKYLYMTIHHPELEAPVTPDLQVKFDVGNLVGTVARDRFPEGVLVDNKPWDFGGSLNKTRELIESGVKVIFEAAFSFRGCYARVDVLKFSEATQRWSMYEVKSSTKVKPEHFEDVALQAWIVAKSGLPLEKISLMHLNRDCVFPNLENLFTTVDVTEESRQHYPKVADQLNAILTAAKTEDTMNLEIGPYCLRPGDCGFKAACWKDKVPQESVFDIYLIKDKAWELYRRGIVDIVDERIDGLEEFQSRIVNCHRTGVPFIDSAGIRGGLENWKFPLIFLDFETIGPAIPRYPGTTPYMQVPFQFSIHVWHSPESEGLEHFEFLHDDISDPRPELIPALLKACQDQGSIVAYYDKFEKGRIQDLAQQAPDFHDRLMKLNDRIVDPLPLFQKHVYLPSFKGSYSLKSVAPAVLGQKFSYDELEISDGSAAQRAFEELISPKISESRRSELRQGMLEYCRQDTLATFGVTRWLFDQAKA